MNQLMNEQGILIPVVSQEEWAVRRTHILLKMQAVMGSLPSEEKRCPLAILIKEEVDCGSYLRRLISYRSEPGGLVPAYLLIPKVALAGNAARAVLCLHQTTDLGHKEVVGLGGKASMAYAAELAKKGFVTLAPAYPHLSDYWPDLKALGYVSGTMKAI
ncbi:MAG: hypothetical protein JKY51_02025, partial [Opitutaceae bacterium]|nr:hypothetical protein [Opitutaceae bacterium]